jgi:hypothetical protein
MQATLEPVPSIGCPAPTPQPEPAQPLVRRPGVLALLATVAALTTGGCASLPAARMSLPAELAGVPAQVLPVPGGRRGELALPDTLGGGSLRFERSADEWSFFDTAEFDRATLALQWTPAGQAARAQQCALHRTGLQLAGVALDVRPARLRCDGAGGSLELQVRPGLLKAGRTGRYQGAAAGPGTAAAQPLEIRSVHEVQGSPLALDQPAGYVLLDGGRPVAAVDLLDAQPRVYLAPQAGTEAVAPQPGAEAAARRLAVVEAALLLALSWEPRR